ncbi:MAG TPA: hypothetical protein VLS90_18940, partial [Thermodesulfobacteriota bacterium]|nr:hypothetical protein [Thermodesulfobacteriota bacterium]
RSFTFEDTAGYFRDGPRPFIYFETVAGGLGRIRPGDYPKAILYSHFDSAEAMREWLSKNPEWRDGNTKAVFIDNTVQDIR